ncbi:MAG: CheY-P phosphatase CheC [Candidatus Scalindua rubra]|uniref:CheY-P phosphatase CheC n=1 Tax=Candidatus Scalindua rubra TaxID=1872076 RepID=A0A1E3XEZ1_9BACT|nr:MAG: CheY-P phosphatase CheC [Candidatus Scalindua rubra]
MQISKEHLKILDIIVKIGMDNASRSFSKTIKRAALIELVRTELVDISNITEEMNNDLREMVAAMLRLEGTFKGKLLFMIPLDGALVLQDFYMGLSPGTSKTFDEYTEGTVQEIGNILASSIGNSFASDLGSTLLPTPPQAICDFAGTIFSSLILEEGINNDNLLMTETKFKLHNTETDCYFFLLPDINTLEESLNILEKSII